MLGAPLIEKCRRSIPLSFDDDSMGDTVRAETEKAIEDWFKVRKGFIYVAANPSWIGLYKLGCTRKSDLSHRMVTLNRTNLPTKWVPVLSWEVYDAFGLEALVKRACRHWRAQGEMYEITYDKLEATVDTVIAEDKHRLQQGLRHTFAPDWLASKLISNKNMWH